MLITRPDGVRLRGLDPMRRMMPMLMPTRNEAVVYYEQIVDATALTAFLDEANRGDGPKLTPLHLVVAALGRVLLARPQLDRFVAGRRLWQRRQPSVAFAAKREFADGAAMKTIKLPVVADEALTDTAARIHAAVGAGRTRDDRPVDRELRLLGRLPDILLSPLIRLARLLDRWNCLPGSLIADDPLFASVFVANLGSLGIDRAWHHLYEHGTVSLFCVIGGVRPRAVAGADGAPVVRPTLRLRFTLDERICDGYYAAQSLELLRADLEDPRRFAAPVAPPPTTAVNAARSTL
ncbi:MAG: 2-oxo acid dehydrogenase subunit E2 [Kofleriaceae bacterium]|nr:2-oxo acid dehydrogenase subunit E2 [Kofleriaceae bacterium]MBP9166512.1 2-oxo acid dehydrogenase subunit E2 [Kofleriaceae bacterium]MBP9859414.1 2-oxo acid dehydrogenase subunit E2 [Kofleriaceae bacterium]